MGTVTTQSGAGRPDRAQRSDTTGAMAVLEQRTTSGKSPARAWTLWFARRIVAAVLTLWAVSVIVFLATSALGDPVRAILGRDFEVSPQRVAQIREALHLDASLVERYFIWLGGLLTGDLGTSVASQLPVWDMIGGRLVNSALLVLPVALLMVPIALGLALLAARYRGSALDNAIQVVTLSLAGVPEFVTGILLVALFSTSVFHLFPAVTALPLGATVWSEPRSLVLPVATLVVAIVPYLTRILRANLLEALDSDYVELARLKGIPENRVLWRHALPNTLVPLVQVTALQLAWLVGGVVLIEYLFNYPGIGATLVDSVRNSDFPMVQALTMIIAAVYVVVNLIADLLSILLTPRARTAMAA